MSRHAPYHSPLTRRGVVRFALVAAGATVGLRTRLCARAATQGQDYTIALIPGIGGDNIFYSPMACGAQAAAEQLGVTLTVEGPDSWDAGLQTNILAKVIASKPDAILIVPSDRTALIEPIQQAVDAGIAVFTLDTFIDADTPLATVASDNVEGGRIAAHTLAQAIGKHGKVFVVNTSPGVSSTDEREAGFAEVIATYPTIDDLGQAYCDDDATIAADLVTAKLQAEPELAGIFGTNLSAAIGAANAVADAGVSDRVTVVGFDATPDQVAQLRAGSATALIAQHPAEMGAVGVQLAAAYLSTGSLPAETAVSTGFTVVTRDNLADPEVARALYGLECDAAPLASPIAS